MLPSLGLCHDQFIEKIILSDSPREVERNCHSLLVYLVQHKTDDYIITKFLHNAAGALNALLSKDQDSSQSANIGFAIDFINRLSIIPSVSADKTEPTTCCSSSE
ncbi:hypothetical protein ACI6Q2_18865 [Chitinophagaceae bacterium LWZ2-11]